MEPTLVSTPVKSKNLEVYGSFYLSGNEFAIGMADLQEVVNAPAKLQEMPLSPDYLLGLFNLRGRILPVVDLHILLKTGTADAEAPVNPCMVVLRRGAAYLGLLFDAVGEIIRVRPDDVTPISQQNISHEVSAMPVSGVICRDGGERIIQILDFATLLAIRNLPLIDRMTGSHDTHHTLTSRINDLYREKLIGFFVGDCNLALEMKAIVAIVPNTGKKPSPCPSELCTSVISFHGQPIPVVDASVLLKIGTPNTGNHILVCRVGKYPVGFEVEGISSIIPYAKDKIMPVPVLEEHRSSIFRGCFTDRTGKDFIVLNDEGMLSQAEIVSTSLLHSNVCRSERITEAAEVARSNVSLLTFRVGKLYGVKLLDVMEVLMCPKELMRAPNLPESVLGILNLRGNPVSVIDPRSLFDLKPLEECTDSRLLVFRHRDRRIAMRVDSVEGIVCVPEGGKDGLPSILFNDVTPGFKGTIEKGVYLTSSGTNSGLLILSSDQIAQRLTEALAA
ncbi:MAG: chemotaxis protein CheW [Acidobacteriaceae bacterium]